MVRSRPVSPLFDASLTVPRASVKLIPRERVSALLDDAVSDHPLTLVTGGAGTGKTLAVASWAVEGRPHGPVAWVSVYPGIRAATRLWTGIVLAVQRTLGSTAPAQLVVPDVVDDEYVAAFAGTLDGTKMCLVLDDVQDLDGAPVWETVEELVRTLPASLRIVLIARHDPPLALHRLRLAGRLGELRAADLAFTDAEASTLLRDRNLVLPDESFRDLMTTTEGWAAGLRLALMALEASPDPVGAMREFSGGHVMVAGYLVEEVVRGLGPERSDFLERTCVTERICGPLARALTGDAAAGSQLWALARDNALVVELADSGWYRYHPLLTQMLRARLHNSRPDLEHELHRRASAWYESSGEWIVALEHALEADDADLAGQVVLRSAAVRIFSPDRGALAEVIGRIPARLSAGRPDLEVVLAIRAFCLGDEEAQAVLCASAERALAMLEEPVRTLSTLNLRVLQAAAARRNGDAAVLAAAGTEAAAITETLSADQAPGWTEFRGAPQAIAAVGELWDGRPRRSGGLLTAALAHLPPSGLTGYGAVYHQGHHALARLVTGDVSGAHRLAVEAVALVEQMGSRLRHESGAAWLALAAAELQRGDAQAAGRAIERGEAAAQGGPDPFVAAGLTLARARRRLLLGDTGGARHHLAEFESRLADHPGMTLLARLATVLTVEAELAAGALDRASVALSAAGSALDAPPVPSGPHASQDDGDGLDEPDLLACSRARVLLASGRAEDVRPAVAHLLDLGGTLAAAAWLVIGLAEDRLRHDGAATDSVARAIDLASAEQAAGVFLPATDRLKMLLRRHLEVVGAHRDFVTSTLAAAGSAVLVETGEQPVPILTDRELSVLACLPTMSSNTEIADLLEISVNTVKQHLKSIHRKLGVTSRREAVRLARIQGLLLTRP